MRQSIVVSLSCPRPLALFDSLYDVSPSPHPQVLMFCPMMSWGVPHPLFLFQAFLVQACLHATAHNESSFYVVCTICPCPSTTCTGRLTASCARFTVFLPHPPL